MKLFMVLLSILSYHHISGYPVLEGGLSEKQLLENDTSTEYGFDVTNGTTSNDSLPLDMHGFGKKVVENFKDGIKTVKDKVKGGIDKVKEKVKGGIDKVKDNWKGGLDKVKNKIKDVKDKIGSKGGGGSGGGYYRDKYDRDYDRDKYNRDYDQDKYNRDKYNRDYYRNKYDRDREDDGVTGSGYSDPNAKWIGLGIGIFMLVVILGFVIFALCKIERD